MRGKWKKYEAACNDSNCHWQGVVNANDRVIIGKPMSTCPKCGLSVLIALRALEDEDRKGIDKPRLS